MLSVVNFAVVVIVWCYDILLAYNNVMIGLTV